MLGPPIRSYRRPFLAAGARTPPFFDRPAFFELGPPELGVGALEACSPPCTRGIFCGGPEGGAGGAAFLMPFELHDFPAVPALRFM